MRTSIRNIKVYLVGYLLMSVAEVAYLHNLLKLVLIHEAFSSVNIARQYPMYFWGLQAMRVFYLGFTIVQMRDAVNVMAGYTRHKYMRFLLDNHWHLRVGFCMQLISCLHAIPQCLRQNAYSDTMTMLSFCSTMLIFSIAMLERAPTKRMPRIMTNETDHIDPDELKYGARTETDTDTDTETETETDTKPEPDPEPEIETKPETKPETETGQELKEKEKSNLAKEIPARPGLGSGIFFASRPAFASGAASILGSNRLHIQDEMYRVKDHFSSS
ncbi:MAG: hypothetical protein ACYCOU_23310 [Sulfobacillus sp.]